MKYNILGINYIPKFRLPFLKKFSTGELVPLDLSENNRDLARAKTDTVDELAAYISVRIKRQNALGAHGGYREKRAIYQRSSVFAEGDNFRNIHLGVDFWLPAGTEVASPMPGVVHSFADNDASGDYGPTIILCHHIGNEIIHSLYGHLSRNSLKTLKTGQLIARGEVFATLGTPDENKDWPPHLHFQLIRDMEGKAGDYPGVCSENEMDHYLKNCPDPAQFFGNQWTL